MTAQKFRFLNGILSLILVQLMPDIERLVWDVLGHYMLCLYRRHNIFDLWQSYQVTLNLNKIVLVIHLRFYVNKPGIKLPPLALNIESFLSFLKLDLVKGLKSSFRGTLDMNEQLLFDSLTLRSVEIASLFRRHFKFRAFYIIDNAKYYFLL
jgi:hypothetical protein